MIFVVAFAFILIKWGIPVASHVVANQLPETAMKSWGDQAEKYVLEMTEPTKLSASTTRTTFAKVSTIGG